MQTNNNIFLKYWNSIVYNELRILKLIGEKNNKVIEQKQSISISESCKRKNDLSFLKRIISYSFSGFSIIFICYLLLNILNNYPAKELGITP
jgi:hypothetical protein